MYRYKKETTSMLMEKLNKLVENKSIALFFDVMKTENGIPRLDTGHEHSVLLYKLNSSSEIFNNTLKLPEMNEQTKEKFNLFFGSNEFDEIVLNVADSTEKPAPVGQYYARLIRERILGAKDFMQAFPALEKKMIERYKDKTIPFKVSPNLAHLEYAQKNFTRDSQFFAPLYAINNFVKHIKADKLESILGENVINLKVNFKDRNKVALKKQAIDVLLNYMKTHSFFEQSDANNNTAITILSQEVSKKRLKEENIELKGDDAFYIYSKGIARLSNFSACCFMKNLDFIDSNHKIAPSEWLAFADLPFEKLSNDDDKKNKNKILKLIAKNFQDIDKKITTPEGNILNSLIPPVYLNIFEGGMLKQKKIEILGNLLKNYPEFYEIKTEDNGLKHSPFSTLFIAQFTDKVTYANDEIKFLDLLENAPKENIDLILEHFNTNFEKHFEISMFGLSDNPSFTPYSKTFKAFIELISFSGNKQLEENLLSKLPIINEKISKMTGEMANNSFLHKAIPFITKIEMNKSFKDIANRNEIDSGKESNSFKL